MRWYRELLFETDKERGPLPCCDMTETLLVFLISFPLFSGSCWLSSSDEWFGCCCGSPGCNHATTVSIRHIIVHAFSNTSTVYPDLHSLGFHICLFFIMVISYLCIMHLRGLFHVLQHALTHFGALSQPLRWCCCFIMQLIVIFILIAMRTWNISMLADWAYCMLQRQWCWVWSIAGMMTGKGNLKYSEKHLCLLSVTNPTPWTKTRSPQWEASIWWPQWRIT
jgi:hypothetical protein